MEDNWNYTFRPDSEEMTMVCGDCQEHILDIDPGDTLGWLVFEASRHARDCDPNRPAVDLTRMNKAADDTNYNG